MKTLFIDTHLWNICIILFQDGKVIKKEGIIVNGPGSFTGVRLGVIIAKTLAYTQQKPIKVISSLECMAVSSGAKEVAFSDNNGYYLGLFDDNFKVIEYKYIANDEIINYPNARVKIDLDYEKIYNFCLTKESVNPHLVNPIYIKKIGIEK